jgi:hypothetical protein
MGRKVSRRGSNERMDRNDLCAEIWTGLDHPYEVDTARLTRLFT